MTSPKSPSRRAEVPFRQLPWILAALFFVLFLVTLNPGPGLLTLATTAKITGWDWVPMLQYPLYFLVTLPIRILPDGLQVMGLNVLSAVMGGLTIALLARSVQLLPQDRTRDQRERERNELSILTGKFAWLPAVTAVIVGGLQLLFWQNATNASTEMLDLLVIAVVIRELLEFRLDQKDNRLVRVALIYGLGVTNNFALIALFPFTLGAMIWILGLRFFRSTLILKLVVAGLAGLSLYLLLPLLAVRSDALELTFWEALKTNLVTQKSMLGIGWNTRLFTMLMCLGSLFPLAIIGIRWPSSFGDTSAAGNLMTRIMFQVLVVVFIAAAVVMNLHLLYAEKAQLETGMSFFSLFYLSALVIGYSVGYLLVVFGKSPEKKWQKSAGIGLLINKVMVGVAFVLPALMFVALLRDNYPQIRGYNHSLLSAHASAMADQLPEETSIVMSDDPFLLYLVEHALERSGNADRHWLVQSSSLNFPGYHAYLRKTIGDKWPELPENMVFDGNVEDSYIANIVFTKGQEHPVRYLHPSFGYFFERMYAHEDGPIFALENYSTNTIKAPLPDEAAIKKQNASLLSEWDSTLDLLSGKLERREASLPDRYLADIESRRMNHWGVRLQYGNDYTNATPWFERAAQLNTNNASALINLEFNRHHLAGKTNSFVPSEKTSSVLKDYRDNMLRVLTSGGPIDTPGVSASAGQVFTAGKNYRQAAQQFLRAMELTPNNQLARAQLVRIFLEAQAPDRALEMIREIRRMAAGTGLNEYAEMDLLSLEASAMFAKGQFEPAVALLESGRTRFAGNPLMRDMAAEMYLSYSPFVPNLLEKAEVLVMEQTRSSPTNIAYRFNLGSVTLLKQDWPQAILLLSDVLATVPEYDAARFNRAIAYLQSGNLDAARSDYEQLLKKAPHDFKINYGLGEIAAKQNRSADAVKHFEAYLKAAPRNTPEYTNTTQRVEQLRAK